MWHRQMEDESQRSRTDASRRASRGEGERGGEPDHEHADTRRGHEQGSTEAEHEHGSTDPEHEHWDFPPARPPLSDERPAEYPDDPCDEAACRQYLESRCGVTHESRPVGQYGGDVEVSGEFVEEHEGAVGQIQWDEDLSALDVVHEDADSYAGEWWSTGTLIDDDLLLTVGHSFAIQNMPRPAEVARHMHVNFDYRLDENGELREADAFDVVELVEHRFEFHGLDYAVARLEGKPGSEYGTVDLARADAREGDVLCIISHPDGLPKRYEAGHATHLHDVRIGYNDIDTADGSSGAGILDGATGKLVGVHSRGGCDPTRRSHNHGVRISSLLDESETLRRLADGSTGSGGGPKKGGGKSPPTTQVSSRGEQGRDESEHTADESDGNWVYLGGGPIESHKSTLESHKSTLESHKSTLESHKSTLESHESTLDSHECALESHRSTLYSHQSGLESHRSTLKSHESTLERQGRELESHLSAMEAHGRALEAHESALESSADRLKAFRVALEECVDEVQTLTAALDEGDDAKAESPERVGGE